MINFGVKRPCRKIRARANPKKGKNMKISNLFKAAAILVLGLNLHAKTIKEGVLTVATEGTYAPFSFYDEKGELTERINKALAELKAEGKLKEISQKYFRKDVSE